MASTRSAAITGTGMCVPSRVVTNNDLAQMMETSDEWIQQRSGIKERRFVADHEAPSDLAAEACRNALQMAGHSADQMDMLIVATLSPEHYFPGTASFLQPKLGMRGVPVMDLRCQCSGFLFALNTARSFVLSGQYKRVLVCGVEVHSRALDLSTRGRDVAVLFGDGAGAVVVEAVDEPETGILSCHMHSEGEHADKLWVEAPRLAKAPHIDAQMLAEGMAHPKMDGKFVFKHAVVRMPEVIQESLKANHLGVADIDHFFFHQANLRINEFVAQSMGIPMTKAHHNIQKFGNCSAASIPMCLDEINRSGLIKKGQLLCLAGFGSGFSWGSVIVRW